MTRVGRGTMRQASFIVLGTLIATTAVAVHAFVAPSTSRVGVVPAAKHPFVPTFRSNERLQPRLQRSPFLLYATTPGFNSKNDTSLTSLFSHDETASVSLPLDKLPAGVTSLLTPVATVLDEATDGWALTYADLTPETESTPAGISFLATNIAYGAVGLILSQQGDGFYGCVTEAAGVISFIYHFTQLKLGPNQAAVRLALLVDYIFASVAILTTAFYLATGGLDQMPEEGLVVGGLGVVSLSLSWVWEVGYPYLFWHSLWHIFSAYAGYLVGQAHLAAIQ